MNEGKLLKKFITWDADEGFAVGMLWGIFEVEGIDESHVVYHLMDMAEAWVNNNDCFNLVE